MVSGLRIDGAELKSASHTLPSRRYAEITSQGRGSRKITIDARFLTEEDLDLCRELGRNMAEAIKER